MCILLYQAPVFLIGYVEKSFDYQWIQNLISFKMMYDSITNSSRYIKKVVVKHKVAFHVNAQYCVFMCTLSTVVKRNNQVMGIVLYQAAVCLISYTEKWFDYQWIQNSISFKKMYDSITNSRRKIKKIVVKDKLRNLSTLNTYRFCDFWCCNSGPFISCMLSPN